MMMKLGSSIMDCARLVKGGVLVFFPSYGMMNDALQLWAGNKLTDEMKKIKPLHVEKQEASNYKAMI